MRETLCSFKAMVFMLSHELYIDKIIGNCMKLNVGNKGFL